MATNAIRDLGAVVLYEQRLHSDRRWGMTQGDAYFRKDNEVFASLRRIVRRLNALGLYCTFVGGLALFEQ